MNEKVLNMSIFQSNVLLIKRTLKGMCYVLLQTERCINILLVFYYVCGYVCVLVFYVTCNDITVIYITA